MRRCEFGNGCKYKNQPQHASQYSHSHHAGAPAPPPVQPTKLRPVPTNVKNAPVRTTISQPVSRQLTMEESIRSRVPVSAPKRPVQKTPTPHVMLNREVMEAQNSAYLKSVEEDRLKRELEEEEMAIQMSIQEAEEKAAEIAKIEESQKQIEEQKRRENLIAKKQEAIDNQPAADGPNTVTIAFKFVGFDADMITHRFLKTHTFADVLLFLMVSCDFLTGEWDVVDPIAAQVNLISNGVVMNNNELGSYRVRRLMLKVVNNS